MCCCFVFLIPDSFPCQPLDNMSVFRLMPSCLQDDVKLLLRATFLSYFVSSFYGGSGLGSVLGLLITNSAIYLLKINFSRVVPLVKFKIPELGHGQ